MKIVIFALLSLLAVVSCDFPLPEDAKDAIPYDEHPRIKAIMQEQHPEMFDEEGNMVAKTPFIVGGNVATLGQLPHQALLFIYGADGYTYLCGGTVVRHNWVLTAAHCVYDSFRRVEVYLGIIDSFYGPAQWGVNVTSRSDVKVHEQYNDNTLLNDIALIRLPGAPETLLSGNQYISNITLPTAHRTTDLVGMSAIVSGFGRTSDVSTQSQWLRYVNQTISATTVCAIYDQGIFVRDSIICVNTTTTASACSGDSGGPLTTVLNGVTNLVGVVSFGAQTCQMGYPTGYTRVTYYLDWMEKTINMSPKAAAINAFLLIAIQVFFLLK